MQDWQPAYIGLGSNLSDPAQQLRRALAGLSEHREIRVLARSRFYRSRPLGPADQPDFVNAVVGILTTLPPRKLLDLLLDLEFKMGRPKRHPRWGPRLIDLDLLVYGGLQLKEPGLTVPHPGIAARRFVLEPLADIAPDLMIPGLGRVSEILKVCASDLVHPLSDTQYD